jgi:hypothetical protein
MQQLYFELDVARDLLKHVQVRLYIYNLEYIQSTFCVGFLPW